MRILFIILIIAGAISCNTKHAVLLASSTCVPVIRSGSYNGYDYFYGLKNNDTIVFVASPEIKAKRGCRVSYIKFEGMHTVDRLIKLQDTISFVYNLFDVNHKGITAGAGAPGTFKQSMHTTGSFPYLIVNDSVFIYEK